MQHLARFAALAIAIAPLACSGPQAPSAPRPVGGQAAANVDHGQHGAAAAGPEFLHESRAGVTVQPYTEADVHFMQGMIGHHAQAVIMAAMVPTHGAGPDLQLLARKIDISQRDEIAFMIRWLQERGQEVPADDGHGAHMGHDMHMPGMLTDEQMEQLAAARGVEFERLFLTFMIEHHRGALVMVDELFASPGAAQDSEIFRFATDVDFDQRAEIFTMQGMLDMLGPTPGSPTR